MASPRSLRFRGTASRLRPTPPKIAVTAAGRTRNHHQPPRVIDSTTRKIASPRKIIARTIPSGLRVFSSSLSIMPNISLSMCSIRRSRALLSTGSCLRIFKSCFRRSRPRGRPRRTCSHDPPTPMTATATGVTQLHCIGSYCQQSNHDAGACWRTGRRIIEIVAQLTTQPPLLRLCQQWRLSVFCRAAGVPTVSRALTEWRI